MRTITGLDELKQAAGENLGTSDWHEVTQEAIDAFADVTGDHQWIHVEVDRARKHSPFGGPVAHGFLTLSLMAAAVASAGVVPPDAQGVINYGLDRIRFIAPAQAGALVTTRFRLAGVDAKGEGRQLIRVEAQVDFEGQDKPAIVGELLAMVFG